MDFNEIVSTYPPIWLSQQSLPSHLGLTTPSLISCVIIHVSFNSGLISVEVRNRALGKGRKLVDKVVNPHRLRSLRHFLRMNDHRLLRQATYTDVKVVWKKTRGWECKISSCMIFNYCFQYFATWSIAVHRQRFINKQNKIRHFAKFKDMV